MLQEYIKKILNARVYEAAIVTPLDAAPILSKRLQNEVLIKREDLQPVFSFKIRGAYNKVAQLSDEDKQRGVIAASAGNHAQGLAYAAKMLDIKATIVMPQTTPDIKVKSVKRRGAKVILHGDTFDEAFTYSKQLASDKGYVYIPPYDDVDIIAGQGTVGMEILRQHKGAINVIFIPVGGGGLIAGVAAYVKYLRPDIKIIGVECEDSACLAAALKKGARVKLPHVGIFAEGVAVALIGEEPWKVAKKYVDEVITVNTDEICAAIKDLYDETRSIAEPSGALSLAGLKKYVEREQCEHQTLVAINSGANMNFDRLRYIAERAELGEKREAILAVTIDEKPGSFKIFCGAIGKRNITEFNYRYNDAKRAHVFVGLQTSPEHGREEILQSLLHKGYEVEDMTDNEFAKLHVRHMVGGHSPKIENEIIYSFEFPERPGALLNFLNHLGERWNISLFHYRNHGAAYGRVLVGVQVPPRERKKFIGFLDEIGYPYTDETQNLAYMIFLN